MIKTTLHEINRPQSYITYKYCGVIVLLCASKDVARDALIKLIC